MLVLLAFVAVALLASCGEQDAPKPPAGPTQAEFVADADLICRQVNQAIAERGFERALDRVARGLQQLRRLEPPEGLALRYGQYITAVEQQMEAQIGGDFATARAADRRKERAAFELGFADCGTG